LVDGLTSKKLAFLCPIKFDLMKNLRLIQKSAIAAIVAFTTSCSQSELAEKLNDTYALKRTFSSSWVELSLDSAYGPQIRLNEYQMGEKRIYFYYEKPNVTFEVSGEGAVNPDLITYVWDGKKL